jgi:hypothetical protein
VAVSWPHILMDAPSHCELLRAWSLVLARRQDEVPPVLGASQDVLITVAEAGLPADKLRGQRRLAGFGLVLLYLWLMWDRLTNPPFQHRTVYLSRDTLERLYHQAKDDLAHCESEKNRPEASFISESDTVIAWLANIIATSGPKATRRPVAIINALNARYRLPWLQKSAGVHIQNMIVGAVTSLPAQLCRGTLGPIALTQRRCLAEQTSEARVLEELRISITVAQGVERQSFPYMGPESIPVVFNNLERVNMVRSVNFSAAVKCPGTSRAGEGPPGAMSCYQMRTLGHQDWMRWIINLGKDYRGGVWLNVTLLPSEISSIERALAIIC